MVGAARLSGRSHAFTFAIAIAVASGACAETFDVSIGCRDGAPNGAYELRSGDGRLRVAGALSKGRRTGTFIFWNARGARFAVVPYDNDQKVGTVALWYTPRGASTEGRRRLEAPYAAGRRHGVTRSWHDNGRPRAEVRYEQGMVAEARAWRRDGASLSERDATALAARDKAGDDALLAELESIVASHLPACESSSPRVGLAAILATHALGLRGDLASHALGLPDARGLRRAELSASQRRFEFARTGSALCAASRSCLSRRAASTALEVCEGLSCRPRSGDS